MSTPRCDHYWLSRRGGTCPHCADVFPGQGQPSRDQLAERARNQPKPKPPGTMEDKLAAALDAADKAFEAGYPVKAHSIIKGALALLAQRPKEKVFEDAMNH